MTTSKHMDKLTAAEFEQLKAEGYIQEKRGGARKGSGRPKLGDKKRQPVTVMMTTATKQQVKNIYGSMAGFAQWVEDNHQPMNGETP